MSREKINAFRSKMIISIPLRSILPTINFHYMLAARRYSPLGGWTRTDVLHHPTVISIATAHQKTTAQVALRWVVQQRVVAVTAARSPEYAKEDLDIFSWTLSDREMAELSGI